MASRFWIGGAGSWTSTTHWSTTSGGASGASIPTSSDNVFFDANSFSTTNQVVDIPAGTVASVNNIDWTGSSAKTPVLYLHANGSSNQSNLYIYGNATFVSGLTIQGTSTDYSTVEFWNSGSVTFNPAGAAFTNTPNMYFNGTGTVTLTGNLSAVGTSRPWTVTLNSGTLDTNGFNLASRYLTVDSNFSKTLRLGSSNIDIQGLLTNNINNLTFDAGTSNIRTGFTNSSTNFDFFGAGLTYYDLTIYDASGFNIHGSNSFHNITFLNTSAITTSFDGGSTQTVQGFSASRGSGTRVTLNSTNSSPFTLSKSSGTITANFVTLQNSTATGGASWYAANSTDNGGNTGWIFGSPITTLLATHTSTGSTSAPLISESATILAVEAGTIVSSALVMTVFQPLTQKEYEYRVYTHTGTFVGIWTEVASDFAYDQSINQAAGELSVSISRSPDNITVTQDVLKDTSGANILDTNGQTILVNTSSKNAVGAGTDVELNYNVDVYAYYGGYESLLDTNGNQILDTDSQPILVEFGSPNGKRVYSGYIADYKMTYGQKQGVQVIVVPHATEMNHYVFKSGSNTTVSYLSVDPVTMARDAMTSYNGQGGIITSSTTSMPLSGWTSSYEFNLQTIKEVIDKTIELLPAGYYHYVHPGENIQYMLVKAATADHTFYYEKHISELVLEKSITQLTNDVYYVGGKIGEVVNGDGTTSDIDLFKHYTDSTSIASYRPGLDRQSDSRVTLALSAQTLSQAEINENKDPRYRTSVTISDGVYDIESIKLGDMIALKNFDNFVDNLLLQVVTLHRQKHSVTIDLDMVVPSDAKRLEEIKRNILSEAVSDIPVAPV